MRRASTLKRGWLLLVLLPVTAQVAWAQLKKAHTVDDILRPYSLRGVALSPEGQTLAYVSAADLSALAPIQSSGDHLEAGARFHTSVWIAAMPGGTPREIVSSQDGTTYSDAIWSPDGQRLALVSQKDEQRGLWVWEKSTGRLRVVVGRGVLRSDRATPGLNPVWVSDHQLLYPLIAEGSKSLSDYSGLASIFAEETAYRGWQKARRGLEATASVVESGLPEANQHRPQGKLEVSDLLAGQKKTLLSGNFAWFSLSPNGRYVACVLKTGFVPPDPRQLVARLADPHRYELAVLTVEGQLVWRSKDNANNVSALFLPPQWSPDSEHLAFQAQASDDETAPFELFSLNLAARSAKRVSTEGLNSIELNRYRFASMKLRWSGKGALLIFASSQEGEEKNLRARFDWWLVRADAPPRNLTSWMKSAPSELVSADDSATFLAVGDGHLRRIGVDGSRGQDLTPGIGATLGSIVWPQHGVRETPRPTALVLSTTAGLDGDLFIYDLASGHIERLGKMPDAMRADTHAPRFALFSPEEGLAIFHQTGKLGWQIWEIARASAQPRLVAEKRLSRGEIEEGSLKKIEYRSLNGQDLKAWLILPVNYEQGRRYPMVTVVYPDTVYGEDVPDIAKADWPVPEWNTQLLAAHGYVVLLPSMPMPPWGTPNDDLLDLTNGVLPAVDRVVEMGIADPKRLGVMGQSYGGFAVYGLITQTRLFQAAVALNGMSDWISEYGQFDATSRYSDFPTDNTFSMSLTETGQARMGNPPWKDLGRYLRNSPIFYVERVQTPLLIVQGDMDYAPLQQGEEFFTALYRQGKRARFVRYWGEGHGVSSPANARDLWNQIYLWFDEFLKTEEKEPADEQKPN